MSEPPASAPPLSDVAGELRLTLTSPAATAALAVTLDDGLAAGDTLLLSGPLGAGKSHFARALIQHRLARIGQVEEVPSPTFTLVQIYQAGPVEIWHVDLYRLSSADEIAELGLDEAMRTAIALIEWPDRLGPTQPERHLSLDFAMDPSAADTRHLTVRMAGPGWDRVAARLATNPGARRDG
ncbi:MAG: tRNA (adenosine(37)-N6)-threonylcarbamoyltransferase complex ATPase subunit type 1 TsaE [Pseudomonadota bacterium]